jgi:hypothetical protein
MAADPNRPDAEAAARQAVHTNGGVANDNRRRIPAQALIMIDARAMAVALGG